MRAYNKKKNLLVTASFVAILVLFFLFVQIEFRPRVILFNNTGKTIRVVNEGAFNDPIVIFSSQEGNISYWDFMGSSIVSDSEEWEYVPPTLFPQSFAYMGGPLWLLEFVNFQVNRDGVIFVVTKDARLPVSDMPLQPAGYPIRPKGQAVP